MATRPLTLAAPLSSLASSLGKSCIMHSSRVGFLNVVRDASAYLRRKKKKKRGKIKRR